SVETDRKVTKAMIKTYRDNLTKGDLPDFYETIEKDFNNDIDAYVDYMFDNSAFTSKAKLLSTVEKEYFTSEADADKISNVFESDPAVQFAISYRKLAKTLSDQINSVSREFSQGKKEYIAGTLAMREGEAIYPDANSTMRLTYGTIQPYSPKDAVVYDYYTTLKGVMEKEDPENWEFVVPEKLKELYATKDFGRYARADGELPACFIMTGDITGGNSGSPVMDADGRLTGLAFDGNWEAMSGDIIFEPDLQRCICVDIRYVLFIIDKYGNAKHLIDEMKIVE
ncbi:MAG: S46 family peptidase, partial [Bacteroidales bacterium]|nr:S46 family peptidase [Bacteroidales bacterium]